jgi:hypothetical protein
MMNQQEASYQVDTRMASVQVHTDNTRLAQLQSLVSKARDRQSETDRRVCAQPATSLKWHNNPERAGQAACCCEWKAVRRLNFAMISVACAFLLTVLASAAWIEASRENDRFLSDVSKNINDIKHTLALRLSKQGHGRSDEASSMALDEPRDVPESTVRSAEQAIRITVDTPVMRGVQTLSDGDSGTTDRVGLVPVSRTSHVNDRQMPATGLTRVPVEAHTAVALSVIDIKALPVHKDSPRVITSRKNPSGADQSAGTAIRDLSYQLRKGLDDGVVSLPVTSGTPGDFSIARNTVPGQLQRNVVARALAYGRNGTSTQAKSRNNPGGLFSLGGTFTRQDETEDLSMPSGDRNSYWDVQMSTSMMGPKVEAEVASSASGPDASRTDWSPEYGMMKLASSTTWHDVSLGASYQTVGKDFEELTDETVTGHKKRKDRIDNDTERTEVWSYRQFGNLGIKAYASLDNSNLAGDPDLPRFSTQKAGGSINYLFSKWPQLGVNLNYATGTLNSSEVPAAFNSVSTNVRDIAGSLYYTGDYWNGSLYTERSTGKAGTSSVANVQAYYADASFYPVKTFTISPSLSYTREEYPDFNTSTDTRSESLAFNYKPESSGLSYTLYGEHSTEKNVAWGMDSSYLYTSFAVNWDAEKTESLFNRWSVEFFYDQYRDNVNGASNSGGPGVMLKLRSSPKLVRWAVNGLR